MVKKITTLNIDSDLIAEAKEKGLNLSESAENGLKMAIGIQSVAIDRKIEKCEFCGKSEEKASCDIQLKYHEGLTWIYPEERWICSSCLRKRARKIL